jgi:UDP-N-acetylmuramoyl-tripeptide--D-alanyl-D-alanine ligase
MSETTVHRCVDIEAAVAVAKNLNKGDVVLVKASRSEKLEILADAISAQWLSTVQEGEAE